MKLRRILKFLNKKNHYLDKLFFFYTMGRYLLLVLKASITIYKINSPLFFIFNIIIKLNNLKFFNLLNNFRKNIIKFNINLKIFLNIIVIHSIFILSNKIIKER